MTEKSAKIQRLEEEGDIAADYLEELLDICDLDGDIDIDVENDRASVEIVSEEFGDRWLRKLVGSDGRVLDALQELTRLAVQAKTGERSRLMLDVAGFRAAIKADLAAEARESIAEVLESGEALRMRQMNPFERKVVHDEVKVAGLVSESEGDEPNRRVVIRPGLVRVEESAAASAASPDIADAAEYVAPSASSESADSAASSETGGSAAEAAEATAAEVGESEAQK